MNERSSFPVESLAFGIIIILLVLMITTVYLGATAYESRRQQEWKQNIELRISILEKEQGKR